MQISPWFSPHGGQDQRHISGRNMDAEKGQGKSLNRSVFWHKPQSINFGWDVFDEADHPRDKKQGGEIRGRGD